MLARISSRSTARIKSAVAKSNHLQRKGSVFHGYNVSMFRLLLAAEAYVLSILKSRSIKIGFKERRTDVGRVIGPGIGPDQAPVARPEQATALTSLRSQKSWIDHQRSFDDLDRPAQRQFFKPHLLTSEPKLCQRLRRTIPLLFERRF